jgi:hypothetical protein
MIAISVVWLDGQGVGLAAGRPMAGESADAAALLVARQPLLAAQPKVVLPILVSDVIRPFLLMGFTCYREAKSKI